MEINKFIQILTYYYSRCYFVVVANCVTVAPFFIHNNNDNNNFPSTLPRFENKMLIKQMFETVSKFMVILSHFGSSTIPSILRFLSFCPAGILMLYVEQLKGHEWKIVKSLHHFRPKCISKSFIVRKYLLICMMTIL